ncbi:MAG: cytochrome c4, partial [Candidatus Competibacteraceae bacterium]|nr:cytochrome c4 [Candidatus Competibacteraceae bacterium]
LQTEERELAETMIFSGDPDRDIPACSDCHGRALMGKTPFIPGLLGLPRVYLSAQFGSWRNGGLIRGQTADCMSEIAEKLTDHEINAIAKWLSIQTVSGSPEPAGNLSPGLIERCGSIVQMEIES